MIGGDLHGGGFFLSASRHCKRAPRMEAATSRRCERAGYIPLQNNLLTFRDRQSCCNESFGIWVEGIGDQLLARSLFYLFAEVHDPYSLAHERNHRNIVSDEKISKVVRPLHV